MLEAAKKKLYPYVLVRKDLVALRYEKSTNFQSREGTNQSFTNLITRAER